MSNDKNADDAEKRKEKLQKLRSKRQEQQATDDVGGQSTDKTGLKKRLIEALTTRRSEEGMAGSGKLSQNNEARGALEMNAGNDDTVPRKKFAMKKKGMKKLAMKKRAMMAMKKRGKRQESGPAAVDASSTLEEISQHRSELENRINRLKDALADRTRELNEVVELEASKLKENQT